MTVESPNSESAVVTFYLSKDEEIQRIQMTDMLPRVGDYVRWRQLIGFWRVTAVVHQFDQPDDSHLPNYFVYTTFERKIRH